MMESISEIEPHLFVGDRASASSPDLLTKLRISHIVTAETQPLSDEVVHATKAQTFQVPVLDLQDEDLLQHFDTACDFIEEALNNSGNVLVHCFHGVSRSASIVLAYLVRKQKLDLPSAMNLLKAKRPCACPNPGFQDQLELFATIKRQSGLSITLTQQCYKMYLLSRIQVSDHSDSLPKYFERISSFTMESLTSSPNKISNAKCKKCRTILAQSINVFPHVPSETLSWTEILSKRINEKNTKECRQSLFIEPMPWMSSQFTNSKYEQQHSKLLCAKCNSKVGSFSTNSPLTCPCAATMAAPGSLLSLNKIDFY